jgi:uncharacterized protein (DUF2141 family)
MSSRLSSLAAALVLVALFQGAALAQGRGSLTITVQGVVAGGGILRLGLYDRPGYAKDRNPVAFADVPAKPGVTTVTLTNIPPGEYGVMVYQDVNSNDRTDSNFLGIPREPYGFSRNAKPFLSKPDFDDVKFTVAAGENSQTLRLQNTGS